MQKRLSWFTRQLRRIHSLFLFFFPFLNLATLKMWWTYIRGSPKRISVGPGAKVECDELHGQSYKPFKTMSPQTRLVKNVDGELTLHLLCLGVSFAQAILCASRAGSKKHP